MYIRAKHLSFEDRDVSTKWGGRNVRTPFPQMGKHRLFLCCNGFEQFLRHACQCVNELCASQSAVVALCSLWFSHLLRTCRWPVDP